MKIYVACAVKEVERAKAVAVRLRDLPHVDVVSRWHDQFAEFQAMGEMANALLDLEDMEKADMFLVLLGVPSVGKYVEFGWALAKGKRIILSGERNTCFMHLPSLFSFANDHEAIHVAGLFARTVT